MALRFAVPPNWPTPPPGWVPPEGWNPLPEWGPAPVEWVFWVEDPAPTDRTDAAQLAPLNNGNDAVQPAGSAGSGKISLFGARGRARELADEVDALRRQLAELGALDIVELRSAKAALTEEIATSRAEGDRELSTLAAEVEHQRRRSEAQLAELHAQIDAAQQALVTTEDHAILQEAGIYDYRHPLTDAAAYQDALRRLQDQIKAATRRDGGAITAATTWTVNGSAAQGRTMVREYSKLMLRAYNAEADNLVRALKPYKLATSVDRLDKVAATIERLGKTMSIQISQGYHRLRVQELELTADYLEKVAVQKEAEREEKARLREERAVQAEIERERQRLEKERQHYVNAVRALESKGDSDGANELMGKLSDIERAISDVDYRAANIRAGYVYVISNVGAFGEHMIKVGMTRRLEPRDRIRELSDASVPFNFDVHALFFSADAVSVEGQMHARLADRRVNRVNHRREFFYATPLEARDLLLEITGNLLEFTEEPEALQFRQSETDRVEPARGRHSAV